MLPRLFFAVLCTVALAAGLVACSGPAVLNAITSKTGYSVQKDLRYAEGERGTFDLYVPDGASAKTPVVIFIYGGGWDSGEKGIYAFLGQSLASEGIAVAIPDYRVYPEVKFPGFVEDGARAVSAIETAVRRGSGALPGGEHGLFLMGHSAGAQIAALLALDRHYLTDAKAPTRRFAGFIGLAGPYDFLPLTEERYIRIFPKDLLAASQPVNFVGPHAPPMLLVAGSADTTVDPKNTLSLAAKVKAAGGTAEVDIVDGVDHIGAVSALATALPFNEKTIRGKVLAFIRSHS
jgi:acetyl esterase/lipase